MRWTKQPPAGTEIDWTHPLTRKLVLFAHPTGAGNFRDEVYGDNFSLDEAGVDVGEAYFLASHPKYGRAFGIDSPTSSTMQSSARDNTFDAKGRFTSTSLSIASVYQIHNTQAGTNGFFGVSGTGGGDKIELGQAPYNTSSQFQTAFSGGINSEELTDDESDAAIGQLKALVSVFKDVGATATCTKWLHNITTGAISQADTTALTNIDPAVLNSDLNLIAMSGTYPAAVYVGAIWDRAISVEEARQFTDNPWQIFRPKPRFAVADMPEDVRLLKAPKPWTKKPPAGTKLDKNHPAFGRLLFAVAPGQSGSMFPPDLVSGVIPTSITGGSTRTFGTDKYGRWLATTADGQGLTYGRTGFDDVTSTLGFTVCWCSRGFANGTKNYIWSTGENGNGYGIEMAHDDVSAVLEGFFSQADNSTGTKSAWNILGPTPENYFHNVAFTHKTASTDGSYYVEGNAVGNYQTNPMTVTAHANRVTKLFAQRNTEDGGDIGLHYIYVFEGVLSPEEIHSIAKQPWQIFEPESIFAVHPYVAPEEGGSDGRDRLFTFKRPWK